MCSLRGKLQVALLKDKTLLTVSSPLFVISGSHTIQQWWWGVDSKHVKNATRCRAIHAAEWQIAWKQVEGVVSTASVRSHCTMCQIMQSCYIQMMTF